MKHFELRFYDRLDVFILRRAFVGASDLAALSEARRLSGAHTIEVWHGDRKVARVLKGNAALASTDRLGG